MGGAAMAEVTAATPGHRARTGEAPTYLRVTAQTRQAASRGRGQPPYFRVTAASARGHGRRPTMARG